MLAQATYARSSIYFVSYLAWQARAVSIPARSRTSVLAEWRAGLTLVTVPRQCDYLLSAASRMYAARRRLGVTGGSPHNLSLLKGIRCRY
jgi:hypothetical protein